MGRGGYAALWVYQRLLYALKPRDEYYGAPGPRWPEAFASSLDPIVTLTFAAQPGGAAVERVLDEMEALGARLKEASSG